jgi:hypothetical protein
LLNQQIVGVNEDDIQGVDIYSQVVLQNFQVVLGCLNSEQKKILQKDSKS